MKRLLSLLIVLTIGGFPASAAELSVPLNQAKLEINGAVCAFCAYGVQKSLSKMEAIDRTQGHKGVEADIENQIITIYLVQGKTIDLHAVSKKIRKGGYEPRAFHLRVTGQIVEDNGRRYLLNQDNNRMYELTGSQAENLRPNEVYDLQLLIDESAIKQLKDNNLPVAQVNTIIQGV